ncbi:hypothetical protein [Halarchaeum nitratireducens]|uniref:Uncharacterized protein n=1 Tax=Halarchaeum nitratireducens TaxID=489913 RepID=A0A830GBK8_9EURY|nr:MULTISPECIES: hypothetical protein [Halarchaeum]MBP2250520.1 hypothetical protein [Halarchaeum solikamskense]GGN14999.1 hypothetical protein GCM10009021_14150 [Halarchaeum nitratireducens]
MEQKVLDVDRYVPSDYLKRKLLSGEIETLTLHERVADPGDTFEVQGATFEITAVEVRDAADLDVPDEDGNAVVHFFERVA